jgi:hypothetical protein
VPVTAADFSLDFSDVRQEINRTFADYVRDDPRTQNEVDRLVAEVRRTAEDVFEDALGDVAADLRKELSVPVNYGTRPPTRSKPGEYPRKDTGRLRGSVRHVTYRAGREILRGVVMTDTPYDQYLVRTRPYDRLIDSKWRRLVEQRLTIALR